MSSAKLYAQVIVPLPFNATFTYLVPEHMQNILLPGHRVIVPFGKRKQYTGIVESITPIAPQNVEPKEIALILDDKPIVRNPQIKLWQWIADYYVSTIGEVYKAALPAGLKIESETKVELTEEFRETIEMNDDGNEFLSKYTQNEVAIINHVVSSDANLGITPQQLERLTGIKNVGAVVSRLIDKGVLRVSEKLNERYHAKTIQLVRLAVSAEEESIHKAFAAVKGAKKQELLLLTLLQLSGANRPGAQPNEVSKEALLNKSSCTTTILRELVKKGIVEIYSKKVSRFAVSNSSELAKLPTLSEPQAKALDQIHKSFLDHNVTLLHGVTASGKTEIYMHLMQFVVQQGKQVLMLVPEIALTTQLTDRLTRVFGDKIIIYHSRFSDNERVDIWNRLLNDKSTEGKIIVGARSSVFLPFNRLGLVIVDEEHESSYKQQDPSPRYNGRDTAIVLAKMHGGKVLLGSATPAIETYYKASTGKYGLVSLTTRFDGAQLPYINVTDMIRERKRGAVDGMFSLDAVKSIRMAISSGSQAIVFQNRRGYAPVAQCTGCAYVPKCHDCDVTLTYHMKENNLQCHYCGAVYSMPKVCPDCKEPTLKLMGFGTERLEDSISDILPESKVLRMDLDTTRNKDAYSNIIQQFSQGKANILVGTQMVTKGLDFSGVKVVTILNADSMLNRADFRAWENAFNTMEQVAGRAGRRKSADANDDSQFSRGQVIIQTSYPNHPVIENVRNHDYLAHYKHCIAERQQYFYPPFTRIIYIYLKHIDDVFLNQVAQNFTAELRAMLGNRVLGPEKPDVARVQRLHIRKIMLKIETQASPSKVKEIINNLRVKYCGMPNGRQLIIYCDVDPL